MILARYASLDEGERAVVEAVEKKRRESVQAIGLANVDGEIDEAIERMRAQSMGIGGLIATRIRGMTVARAQKNALNAVPEV